MRVQTKENTCEHESNTEENDIMLRADNQWLCSWVQIPELVKDEKIKVHKLSYDSQMYLLVLGQFLHVFNLNEPVDISKIYAKELSRIREITSGDFIAAYSLRSSSSVHLSLKKLVNEEILYRTEGGYIVYDRLFGYWLRRI